MIGQAVDRTCHRFDRWPAAGIATASADGLKTRRSGFVAATEHGHKRLKYAATHQRRGQAAPVAFVFSVCEPSPTNAAPLKTP